MSTLEVSSNGEIKVPGGYTGDISSVRRVDWSFAQIVEKLAKEGKESCARGEGPAIAFLSIDADAAQYLLSLSWTGNRRINSARVQHLKKEMMAGRWREACQDNIVIAIDEDGFPTLLNGQHRLTALVEAAGFLAVMAEQGPALSFTIAFGVELDTYRVMDTGMARSAYAALENAGCIHPKIAAAATKGALHYLEGGAPDGRGEQISPEKVFGVYGEWKDELKLALEACMCFGNRSGGPLLLNQSTAVALHLLFQLESVGFDDEINDFFHRLHTGFGIADGRDPIGKARKELAKLETRETKAKRAAIVVNAWNAIYGGPKNGIASWRATDPREQFPRIL